MLAPHVAVAAFPGTLDDGAAKEHPCRSEHSGHRDERILAALASLTNGATDGQRTCHGTGERQRLHFVPAKDVTGAADTAEAGDGHVLFYALQHAVIGAVDDDHFVAVLVGTRERRQSLA